ncbi:MAG: hypothetical protein PHH91_11015 [Desulfuromonadaceae bacterium]|nr:hypothetical protein [Desulfuromonadaceae bacterium]
MNFKKVATISVAAGALVAISVPAFAMENEFHGMYRLRAIMSNYENSGGGVLSDNSSTLTAFEQRARLQYTAKANADLKLVTQFEIDSSWGDASYANGRGTGGAMGADTVNLETKHVYLDYNCPLTGANFKVGIQAQGDAYKGVLFNDDMGGAFATKKFGAVTAKAGFARMYDNAGANVTGQNTGDLYLLDAKYAVSKDLSVGGSYYLVHNDTLNLNAANMHMVGVNAAAKFGIVNADAFVAYQGGTELYSAVGKDLSAFAAQLNAQVNLDKAGTVRANVLYLSGDDGKDAKNTNEWQSLKSGTTQTSASNNYYGSKMKLLVRNAYNMDTDKALVFQLTNLTILTAGYDAKINDKLGASVNVGYAMFNEKGTRDSASIGTELNGQLDYKMFSNLTASLEAAYVVLGDAYKGTGGAVANKLPDNPYMTSVMMNYSF